MQSNRDARHPGSHPALAVPRVVISSAAYPAGTRGQRMQAPGAASRLRVLNDWVLSLLFPGNIVAFAGLLDPPTIGAAPARPLAAPHRFRARDSQDAGAGPGFGDG